MTFGRAGIIGVGPRRVKEGKRTLTRGRAPDSIPPGRRRASRHSALQMSCTRNALLLRDDATTERMLRDNNRVRVASTPRCFGDGPCGLRRIIREPAPEA